MSGLFLFAPILLMLNWFYSCLCYTYNICSITFHKTLPYSLKIAIRLSISLFLTNFQLFLSSLSSAMFILPVGQSLLLSVIKSLLFLFLYLLQTQIVNVYRFHEN